MTKYLLITWIGAGYSQTIDIAKFDTLTECEAAMAVILDAIWPHSGVECLPYTYEPEPSE